MSTLAPSTIDLASRLDRQAPAVEVRDLRKTFRRRDRKDGRFARKRPWPALDDVTFTIARGECVAILGQNGSGKSTLVRLLSTLLISDGGEARIFGHDVDREDVDDPPARQPRLGRGELLQEDVRRPRTSRYAARFYGMTPRADAQGGSRRSSGRSASRPSGAARRWRTSRAACSRRSRSRGRS